jgi:predicted membrane protein
MQLHEDWRGKSSVPGILPALVVIGIGVLFLLNNLNIFFVHDIWRFWPGILIAIGLVKMVDSATPSGRVMGGILAGAGGLFLADNLGFLNLSWESFWPLVLIGAGVLMLWHRLAPAQTATPNIPTEVHEGVLNEFAIFGGVDRKVTTDDFRGGQITAMFGGANIDLRRAGIRGDSAVIDVTSMFGGIDFKVPTNWIVVSQIAAIFGGFGNKSVQPNADTPGVKRLYIKGVAMFGGVGMKN